MKNQSKTGKKLLFGDVVRDALAGGRITMEALIEMGGPFKYEAKKIAEEVAATASA